MTSKSNLIEAINLRHTVRRYKPTEIDFDNRKSVSYTHLTLPTNREV